MLLECKTIGFEKQKGQKYCTLFHFWLQGFDVQDFKIAHDFWRFFGQKIFYFKIS